MPKQTLLKSASSCVSVAVNNQRQVENWSWQVEECFIICHILLVFVLAPARQSSIVEKWNVLQSVNVYGFASVVARNENSFTAFLCQAGRLSSEERNWKCSFTSEKLQPAFNFLLPLAFVRNESVNESERWHRNGTSSRWLKLSSIHDLKTSIIGK